MVVSLTVLKTTGADRVTVQSVPDASPPGYSTRYIWYVVSLLAVVNCVNYMDRMALSVLLPAIKTDLQLSDSQLGLLVGLAFSVFYAVCAIPIARFADSGNRRNIIVIALTVWSAMTAISGAAQNFWQLFLARIGVGSGEAGCIPPSQSVISDYVPLEQRAGAHALHNIGLWTGLTLGMALAGWLGDWIGWRWAFVVLGIPGLLIAVLVGYTLKEPPRGYSDGIRPAPMATAGILKRMPLKTSLTTLFNSTCFKALLFFNAVNSFLQYGLNQWLPSFYMRSHGLEAGTIGISLGIALGIGSCTGLIISSVISPRMAAKNIALPLKIGGVASLLAMPIIAMSLFAATPLISLVAVFIAALLLNVIVGPAIASAQSVFPSELRAMASAITVFCASVLGLGLGPFFVGVISDLLRPVYGDESLRYALFALVFFVPLISLAIFKAARHLQNDIDAIARRRQGEQLGVVEPV